MIRREKAAAAAGKAAARADRRAGGFAAATDHPTPAGMTARQEAAYNRAYRRAAPRSWYRDRPSHKRSGADTATARGPNRAFTVS